MSAVCEFSRDVMAAWKPRPDISSWDWICENVRGHDGNKFDGDNLPWCKGVCAAFDDPFVREIVLQWAARVGKTLICHAMLLNVAACDPQPMLFGEPNEALLKRIIKQKVEKMLEQCDALGWQLRPPNRRSAYTVQLRDCVIQGAWSGSETMLADFSARVSHAGEVDKWDVSTSGEGDTLEQFLARSGEFVDRKNLIESTPQEKTTSRIEARRLAGNNCRYHIPCPKCGKFQQLVLGSGNPDDGGIIWDHDESGHSDPDQAFQTARYKCPTCKGEWGDEYKAQALRKGVWVPEGQAADKAGKLIGKAKRSGRIWSSQMAAWYSIQRTFGSAASDFVRMKKRPSSLKAFVQLVKGETWESRPSRTLPEQLGERLKGDTPRLIVPSWASFITVGIDKQGRDGGYLPYIVLAWGDDEKSALIDYGESMSLDDVYQTAVFHYYQHEDGGYPMQAALALVDSGFDTKAVYDFVRGKQRYIVPCKGMDASSNDPYRIVILDGGKSRTGMTADGLSLVHINVDFWETEVQASLEDRKPGEPGSLTFFAGAGRDMELCEQLLNGVQGDKLNARGVEKLLWIKKDENAPNDYRDAYRMARCAAKVWLDTRNGRLPQRSQANKPTPVVVGGEKRRDGRDFV